MAEGNSPNYGNVSGFPLWASAYESVSLAEQVDMLRRLETLEHLAAKQVEEDLREQTINMHGVPTSRMDPLPGVIPVVPDQDILNAIKIMCANGFNTFESQIETALFSRVVTVINDEGKNYVEPTPVNSTFKIFSLRSARGSVLRRMLRGRINIVDPVFENGGNEIPPAYIRGVLNVLNAFKLFNAMDKKQVSLQDLLTKLQVSSTRITQAVVTMMGIWKAKTVPATVDNLRAWQMHALIHERVHFLIHALPANDLPEGNDPETRAQRERLLNITFEKYMEMIFPEGWAKGKHDIYLETAVGAKNIYKALQSIKSMAPGSEAELTFKQICAIEMFCDRFAMFLAENAAKQEIYKAALKES